ncbi:hypothetical protein NMR63_003373 [Vibrio cholerae]|nr:hypothetical protein [Vibrio cholerae]EJL6332773.1 hypothetical protein [Vibrio cholerae]RBO12857.1 hypothetical protein DSL61_18735 [Vibrio cholerae]
MALDVCLRDVLRKMPFKQMC